MSLEWLQIIFSSSQFEILIICVVWFLAILRLAERVAAATYAHTIQQVESDLALIEAHFEEKQSDSNRQARSSWCHFYSHVEFSWVCQVPLPSCPHYQGNLDLRYLSDRYERGVKRIEEYMSKHQRYAEYNDINAGLPDFLSLMQTEGGPHKFLCWNVFQTWRQFFDMILEDRSWFLVWGRLGIVIIDLTLWPQGGLTRVNENQCLHPVSLWIQNEFFCTNADLLSWVSIDVASSLCSDPSIVDESVALARSVCSASSDAICFCMLPVLHGSTKQEVILKHRRHFEDLFMASTAWHWVIWNIFFFFYHCCESDRVTIILTAESECVSAKGFWHVRDQLVILWQWTPGRQEKEISKLLLVWHVCLKSLWVLLMNFCIFFIVPLDCYPLLQRRGWYSAHSPTVGICHLEGIVGYNRPHYASTSVWAHQHRPRPSIVPTSPGALIVLGGTAAMLFMLELTPFL